MDSIPFKEAVSTDNKVAYSTRQGVMYNTKNFRAAKREKNGQYSVMAIKVINKTELPIALGDLAYSCGGSTSVAPVKMDEYVKNVKQKAGLYWLYLAGVVPNPFGKGNLKKLIPWGVAPAVINFSLAHRANKKMEKELRAYDLSGKVLQPYDSIMGVLPFKGINNCGEIYITVKY